MKSSALVFCYLIVFITLVTSHETVNPLNPNQQEMHNHGAEDPQTNNHGGAPPVQQGHVPPNTPVHHRGQGQPGHAGRHQPMMDKEHVHDQEHIMEHLDGKINPEQKMTDEELQFHYFKVHDYDGNDMLDGIELISALSHHNRAQEGEAKTRELSDEDMASAIDDILRENDANGDGYVDYPEFVSAQRESDAV